MNQNSRKRLFVATTLPENVKEGLVNLQRDIKGLRWAERDSLHLTLRFIGSADEQSFADVERILRNITEKSFSLSVTDIGFWKSGILWAKVERSSELVRLKQKIDDSLEQLGIAQEVREFFPHITLARSKDDLEENELKKFLEEEKDISIPDFEVNEFLLFQSKTLPSGVKYVKEASYSLGESL